MPQIYGKRKPKPAGGLKKKLLTQIKTHKRGIKMPVKNKITIKETIDYLNDLLKADPDAINALFSCNKSFADHPTLQVAGLSKNYFIFGIIGLLNGLFGADKHGWGHICADYKGTKITGFRALTNEDVNKYTAT